MVQILRHGWQADAPSVEEANTFAPSRPQRVLFNTFTQPELLLCKDDNSFQVFHFLFAFLLFLIAWGIFFFRANSKRLNLIQKYTVRAR